MGGGVYITLCKLGSDAASFLGLSLCLNPTEHKKHSHVHDCATPRLYNVLCELYITGGQSFFGAPARM